MNAIYIFNQPNAEKKKGVKVFLEPIGVTSGLEGQLIIPYRRLSLQ